MEQNLNFGYPKYGPNRGLEEFGNWWNSQLGTNYECCCFSCGPVLFTGPAGEGREGRREPKEGLISCFKTSTSAFCWWTRV